MTVILVVLAIVVLVVVAILAQRELAHRRELRIRDNEYNTAVTLWNFALIVKQRLDEMAKAQLEVLDFNNLAIPHGSGYRLSLELTGYGFVVYAVPDRYDRTGRLSFYVDRTLTVRASDHAGEAAQVTDPEYTG
jgi:hypothetical protein